LEDNEDIGSDDAEEDGEAQPESVIVNLTSEADVDEECKQAQPHPYMNYFNELLELEAEECQEKSWRVVVRKQDLKIFIKKTKDSPVCMVKAYVILDFPIKAVHDCIWETNIRMQWETLFAEFRILETAENYDVIYYLIKVPFGLTRRDFLQRRSVIRDYPEQNTIIMHFKSMEHPAMPVRKKIIRADTIISGYILRPISESRCSLTIISQNDVKGVIPKMIVNRFAGRAPKDWVKSLIKGCTQYMKKAY
jgi:hypothetical protein